MIFGYDILQVFTPAVAILGAIWGYARLVGKVESSQKSLDRHMEATDKRISQLELESKVHSANMSGVSASLGAIQTQLAALTTRLDSLLSQLLEKR